LSNRSHPICKTRRAIDSSQGRHGGSGNDEVTDQVVHIISDQCIHSVWRDADSKRIIESSNRSHPICKTRRAIDSSQGRHGGSRDVDLADQVTKFSNQCIHSVWRDADSNRILKSSNRSHSICKTRRAIDSSQGRHGGSGDDDLTDQVVPILSNQCIHSVW
jgi:hypothetical protein